MARLDRFIQVLHEQRADALQLAVGQPAALVTSGAARAITKDPLTDGQIVGLVREIAGEAAMRLGGGAPVAFGYHSPSGEVRVEVTPGAEGSRAVVRPARPANGPSGAGAVKGPDLVEARGQMEGLLRLLVESNASDLHLRSGQPPMLRRQGDLGREESEPISAERLETLLISIMAPKEIGEFREGGDTDWAYEIEGLARFRCNAGQDRHGPIAVFRIIPTTVPSADDMGLSREVQNLCISPKGLVLVTGPTGSGKSTTLAALVDLINRTPERSHHHDRGPDRVRAPEQELPGEPAGDRRAHPVVQARRCAPRCARIPTSSWSARCATWRPIAIAIETAETGHLVFGTLHTTTRGLHGRPHHRPVPRGPAGAGPGHALRVPQGRDRPDALCKQDRRRAASRRCEILLSTPAVAQPDPRGEDLPDPFDHADRPQPGMVTLNDALMELVDNRLVEPKEAYIKAVEKAGFAAALKARRHDISFLGEG